MMAPQQSAQVPRYLYPPAWPPPPPKKSRRWLAVAVVVIVVVAIIAIAVVATLLTQPSARFVSIAKTGPSGNSMHFDVAIRTAGASIGPDKLHVNIRSIQSGTQYDAVQFYNIDTIAAGRTFTWDVNVTVNPVNLAAFVYEFTLEVNGNQMDSSTTT
jgi:hypothetical protein